MNVGDNMETVGFLGVCPIGQEMLVRQAERWTPIDVLDTDNQQVNFYFMDSKSCMLISQ